MSDSKPPTRLDRPDSNESGPNESGPNESGPNENGPNENGQSESRPNESSRNENGQSGPNDRKPFILDPPACVSGMKQLDRAKFEKRIPVTCLKAQSKDLKSILKFLKPYLLKKVNFHPVVKQDDQRTAIIHLSPEFNAKLSEDEAYADLKKQFALEEEERQVTLNYENFNHQEILTAILSADQLNISSFSVIGHIIHLNLKDEFQPYRSVIGQVLLDKNPSQDLVLNKLDKIDSVYRYFQFDVLARRNESASTVVQVNENGLRFKMDFAKVYWNPRLSTEHDRIVQLLNDGDVVYDVFAGIGPFAIPAAKRKRCRVLANDLNPESYNYLNENSKLNKVANLKAYNLDGREFIRETVKEDLVASWRSGGDENEQKRQFHIIMNLPAIAVEFLDAFVGLTNDTLDDQSISDLHRNGTLTMPTVYCYCFHPYDQDKSQMIANVKSRLNCEAIDDIQTHFVRKVAPAKDMYRLTFRLPQQVLFAEPPNKRMKTA